MAVTAPPPRKYNPGFLTDDELVASFCVRTSEFESIVEMLRECPGSSNPHQIVIGPRGSGKTSLLLRVAAEVRRDAALSSAFFPVVFAEESYEVATAGEFWLECLSLLADQAPQREGGPDLQRTFKDLRTLRDDRTLGERCLAALLDFSDREGRRLVLMVENLNMMFRDMADSREAGWRLRKTLQTEPRIVLLASATSRFDEIDHPDHALYDLFRTLTLRPLGTKECAVLWEVVSGQRHLPETIRSLEILTGGSPRLLAIVARFGGGLSFRELMADLLDLVDDHTEYFKSHLESLPAQERRVYLALADLWKPAFTKEIADRARLETSKCSAQLTRLVERGAVQVAGGTVRRKQYYLSERLYNIYYLLRRNRGPDRLIEALIRFMASYYSPAELKDIGVRIAREVESMKEETRSKYQKWFSTLSDVMKTTSTDTKLNYAQTNQPVEITNEDLGIATAKGLFQKGIMAAKQGQTDDALSAFDDVVRRFGESEISDLVELVAKALAGRGFVLDKLNRLYDAQAAWEELVYRFGKSENLEILVLIVEALMGRGFELKKLDRPKDALTAWDAVVDQYGESEKPEILVFVARALIGKGNILYELNRIKDALAIWNDVVHRFGRSENSVLLDQIAQSLVYKGFALSAIGQAKEALDSYKDVVHRFEKSKDPDLCLSVALALTNMGFELDKLNRPNDALVIWDKVVHRFSESKMPTILELVAKSLINKGNLLEELDRPQDALAAYDEVVNRFGGSEILVILELVASALFHKGIVLDELSGPNDALAVWNEIIHRFEKDKSPELLKWVVRSLVRKGNAFDELNRPEEALVAYDELVHRFKKSEMLDVIERVAMALFWKGTILDRLGRMEDAMISYNELLHQFGENDSPAIRKWTGLALLEKADWELERGWYRSAISMADQALNQHRIESPQDRWRGLLIRAKATLASGDPSACEQDIKTMFTILPEFKPIPKEDLDVLIKFSIEIGPARMREMIRASPAAVLLLPFTTALEREMGLESRVAREVEEVAEDIRRDLAKAEGS